MEKPLESQLESQLNSPSVKPAVLLQQLIAIVVTISIVIALVIFGLRQLQASDPYIHDVLALNGDPTKGHAIFQMNCAGCHGLEANGRVGPSLLRVSSHKSKVGLIHQVISGKTPPMPQFQPSPQIMSDLLSYLETL